jgi:hypothetical protein
VIHNCKWGIRESYTLLEKGEKVTERDTQLEKGAEIGEKYTLLEKRKEMRKRDAQLEKGGKRRERDT